MAAPPTAKHENPNVIMNASGISFVDATKEMTIPIVEKIGIMPLRTEISTTSQPRACFATGDKATIML